MSGRGAAFEIEWIDAGRPLHPSAPEGEGEGAAPLRGEIEAEAEHEPAPAASPSARWSRRHTFLLRRRLQHARATLGEAQRDALRLLPVLFHATFRSPGLSDEPPGVRGIGRPEGWGALARRFRLPPPLRSARSEPLLLALLARPEGDALSVLLILKDEIAAPARERLERRLGAARTILERKVRVHLEAVPLGALEGRDDLALAFGLEGALVAGEIGPQEAGPWIGRPIRPETLADFVQGHPDPLVRLMLLLLLEAEAIPAPLACLAGEGAPTLPLWPLAEGRSSAVAYAALACGRRAHLLDLFATVARPGEERRRAVRLLAAETGMDEGAVLASLERDPEGFLVRARALGVAALRALRASPLRRDRALCAWVREELLGSEVPRALLPALTPLLEERPWRVVPAERGFLVRSGGGTVLLETRSEPMARARALALAVDLAGRAVDPFEGARHWQRVASVLARREARQVVYLLELGGGDRPEATDPLEHTQAIAIVRRPGARVAGRLVERDRLLEHLLRAGGATRRSPGVSHPRGREGAAGVTFLPLGVRAMRAVARFSQVHRVLRSASEEGLPAALLLGGDRVLLVHPEEGVRRFSREAFVTRPRALFAEPGLLGREEEGSRLVGRVRATPILHAHLQLRGEAEVQIQYRAAGFWLFEERVALDEIGSWLAEGQRLVSGAPEPAILTVTADQSLERALARSRASGRRVEEVAIELEGTHPLGLAFVLGGQRYGAGEPLGWRAAAETILARTPVGRPVRLRFSRVVVRPRGAAPPALLLLHARSLARRRLQAHLGALS